MDTNNNMLYSKEAIEKMDKALQSTLIQVPKDLQADAEKALGELESVQVPKKSDVIHMKNLAEFAATQRNIKGKKKKRNRSASQSRRKNRR